MSLACRTGKPFRGGLRRTAMAARQPKKSTGEAVGEQFFNWPEQGMTSDLSRRVAVCIQREDDPRTEKVRPCLPKAGAVS